MLPIICDLVHKHMQTANTRDRLHYHQWRCGRSSLAATCFLHADMGNEACTSLEPSVIFFRAEIHFHDDLFQLALAKSCLVLHFIILVRILCCLFFKGCRCCFYFVEQNSQIISGEFPFKRCRNLFIIILKAKKPFLKFFAAKQNRSG